MTETYLKMLSKDVNCFRPSYVASSESFRQTVKCYDIASSCLDSPIVSSNRNGREFTKGYILENDKRRKQNIFVLYWKFSPKYE